METDGAGDGVLHREEAGIWTWCVETNLVYADTALADLFGIPQHEALAGLPIEKYLSCIHPADRPRVSKSISDAFKYGGTYFEEYLVGNADDYQKVMAYGRCFMGKDGQAGHFAGIVHPVG